ncbi:MAG: ABC transporter permease [Bacteroidota bacterium]
MTTFLTHFRHNLAISWRNLVKNRTTSLINILGLAIGVGAFISIFTIVQYVLSFNSEIKDQDRIYRIYSTFSGSFSGQNRGVPIPAGLYVEENLSGFETVAYFHTYAAAVEVSEGDERKDFDRQYGIILTKGAYFDLVDDYEWLAGNRSSALEQPNKVVLTSDQGVKYFGNIGWDQMIDREVIYRDSLHVLVSGIVNKPSYQSDFYFTDFISHSTINTSWLKERYGDGDWESTSSFSQLWVKVDENTTLEATTAQIMQLNEHAAGLLSEEDFVHEFKLQPVDEVHFNPELGTFNNGPTAAHARTLTTLSILACAILLIAIFNFINLETAQSSTKSKEVGVRKVLGSSRGFLVSRFLVESIMITFFAILISIPIAHFGFAYFQEFLPEGVQIPYASTWFWINLLIIGLLVGLLSGFYPSWIISSFQPIKALKSGLSANYSGSSFLRKSLIMIQFVFFQLLVVGTMAISLQIAYMLDKDLGFDDSGVIFFYTPYYESFEKQKLIMDFVNTQPEVLDHSKQNYLPAQNGYSTTTVKYQAEEREIITSVHIKSGDTTFFNFFGIEMLAGRNLLPNDTLKELLINESFMQDLGYVEPEAAIGSSFEFWDEQYTVAGVVADFHFRSLHHEIEPMVYTYDSENRCIALKVGKKQLSTFIEELTDKWDQTYSQYPLTLYFMDERIEQFYETERRASKLASLATAVTILISCLGLFGLISFTIIRKSKEVGIRKALGASTSNIAAILSKEFVRLIVLAFIVSTPLSYAFITKMLSDFAYTVEISWWIYLIGGLVSFVIAMLAIAAKVWKAAAINPIAALKYE